MLIHTVIGPNADGRYIVVYPTPGCNVFTAAGDCASFSQAEDEARRLNYAQVQREEAIQRDRALRGFRVMSSDLRNK